MLSFFAFLLVHVTLIVMTGFARNMNHIVLGTNDQGTSGHDAWVSLALESSFSPGSLLTTSRGTNHADCSTRSNSSPIRCNSSR